MISRDCSLSALGALWMREILQGDRVALTLSLLGDGDGVEFSAISQLLMTRFLPNYWNPIFWGTQTFLGQAILKIISQL